MAFSELLVRPLERELIVAARLSRPPSLVKERLGVGEDTAPDDNALSPTSTARPLRKDSKDTKRLSAAESGAAMQFEAAEKAEEEEEQKATAEDAKEEAKIRDAKGAKGGKSLLRGNTSVFVLRPHEVLIKNELIGVNVIEAKLGAIPLQYPAILGPTFGGIIVDVGFGVTRWKVGDRVVVSKRFGTVGNQYGAYQRCVVIAAGEKMVAKVEGREGIWLCWRV
ncbi:hypothetical protein EJ02DRAFT_421147 [Clathrospora elynae]|uniref:Alcohol dehydrogenase-like N-terminal domain-containing protein n=1 Tax=Clathrospora elynae TaxID=706981 RepID=A0A6A5SSH6_9PLEO|nr:hypothetical protein EJ02DRAFT_421147 [Clathrospora elynae]